MGRKAVEIARKRGIILLCDSDMSQCKIFRRLNISRHCIRQTIHKFNKLHAVTTKSEAGRRSKLPDRRKRAIKLQQVHNDTLSLNDLVRYVQKNFNLTIRRRTVGRILNEFDMVSYTALVISGVAFFNSITRPDSDFFVFDFKTRPDSENFCFPIPVPSPNPKGNFFELR